MGVACVCVCACARACVCDARSMCTIQVHSFRCYYYTSETLAKKSSKAQLWEAHRRGSDNQTQTAAVRRARGGSQRERTAGEEKKGWSPGGVGWGGWRSEDSQAVEQVKAKTT